MRASLAIVICLVAAGGLFVHATASDEELVYSMTVGDLLAAAKVRPKYRTSPNLFDGRKTVGLPMVVALFALMAHGDSIVLPLCSVTERDSWKVATWYNFVLRGVTDSVATTVFAVFASFWTSPS